MKEKREVIEGGVEMQKFILEWLNTINETVVAIARQELVRIPLIRSDRETELCKTLADNIAKLNLFSAKEVKPDGRNPEIDP